MSEFQWRVVSTHAAGILFRKELGDERRAYEWAWLERRKYPGASVVVERREIGEWEPVEGAQTGSSERGGRGR